MVIAFCLQAVFRPVAALVVAVGYCPACFPSPCAVVPRAEEKAEHGRDDDRWAPEVAAKAAATDAPALDADVVDAVELVRK